MIFPSPIENKYILILTFASAIPFLRPRDPPGGPEPQVGKPVPLSPGIDAHVCTYFCAAPPIPMPVIPRNTSIHG